MGSWVVLPEPGLPGHDDHLVVPDRSEQVVTTRGHRQLRRVGDRGDRLAPPLHPGPRLGKLLLEARSALLVAPTEAASLAAKTLLVPQRQLAKRRLFDERHHAPMAPARARSRAAASSQRPLLGPLPDDDLILTILHDDNLGPGRWRVTERIATPSQDAEP